MEPLNAGNGRQYNSSTSLNDTQLLRQKYETICADFERCAEDGSDLDIYQVTAFFKYYHTDDPWHAYKYAWYCFQSILCALIQTLGIVMFLSYELRSDWEELQCTMTADWDLRIVATLFSAYISVQIVTYFNELNAQGLYAKPAYMPEFLGNEWVYLGLYCNAFTLMAATFGSFLLIYTSDTTIDIILNALALYFIIEMDDNLVDHLDYLRIAKWFETEYDAEYFFNENRLENVRYRLICGMPLQISGRKGGCNTIKLVWVFVGAVFVSALRYISLLGAVAAPILIAVCY